MKILVAGAGGLVGRAVVKRGRERSCEVVGLDHRGLDISAEQQIKEVFNRERPGAVVNCAAWTDVDGCELDMHHALMANARGPELLALACCKLRIPLITISTDYVFDGEKGGFYDQRDQPNPKSVYAQTKLEGERRAQQSWAGTMVVRSGYIFGEGGTNFLSTFIARARRGERVRAIRDCIGTPTYANDLARQIYNLLKLDLPGIYHVVNSGEGASFEELARLALSVAGIDERLIESISSDDLRRPAPRPRDSRLRCLMSPAVGLQPLPPLDDAVSRFVVSHSGEEASDIAMHVF